MDSLPERLVFVDVETTGLDPSSDRIVDIGVVTLDGEDQSDWGSLLNPGRGVARALPDVTPDQLAEAPRFADIAHDLARRLSGRVLVAHNARFDYAFLQAEFARCGIDFEPPSVCTVMLTRRLMRGPLNLDALAQRFGVAIDMRHRALPDARALCGIWRAIRSEYPEETLCRTLSALAREPLLPEALDESLVDRAPEAPGVYVLRDGEGRALHVGTASDLRRDIRDYFRLDRSSAKASRIAGQVRSIDWQRTEGALGARLRKAAAAAKPSWSLRLHPDASLEVVASGSEEDSYGFFASERKARNAQKRYEDEVRELDPTRRLARLVQLLSPLRIRAWPYEGPVALRERRELHVFQRWCYLGSARNEGEARELLRNRGTFEQKIYKLLCGYLERSPGRLVPLPAEVRHREPEGHG